MLGPSSSHGADTYRTIFVSIIRLSTPSCFLYEFARCAHIGLTGVIQQKLLLGRPRVTKWVFLSARRGTWFIG